MRGQGLRIGDDAVLTARDGRRDPGRRPRHRERPLSGRGGLPYPHSAEQVCERHGAALFCLAYALLGDRNVAETAVAEVITDACAVSDAPLARDEERHDLAQLVYLRCTGRYVNRSGDLLGVETLAQQSRRSAQAVIGVLCSLSLHQRAAITLVLFGDHSCREVSGLLDLPTPQVADLLLTGLRQVHQ